MEKRSSETSGFGPELGQRLRKLRRKQGLTQKQVAELMAGGRGQNMVSELETGKREGVSLRLLADFLRAVRGKFKDIADVLDKYTSLPRQADAQARSEVKELVSTFPAGSADQVSRYDLKVQQAREFAGNLPEAAEKRKERARKLSAALERRREFRRLLSGSLTEQNIGTRPNWVVTQHLTNYGMKLWAILQRTRSKDPAERQTLLDQATASLLAFNVVPEQAIRFVRQLTEQTFADSERTGS